MNRPTNTPYADTLTTLLTKPSSEIIAWLRTEQAKGVLPVNVAVTVIIELVSRTITEPQPALDPAGVMAGLVQAAENYLGEATFPAWAGEDCRRCKAGIGGDRHEPTCEYWLAECALIHWVGVAKDIQASKQPVASGEVQYFSYLAEDD